MEQSPGDTRQDRTALPHRPQIKDVRLAEPLTPNVFHFATPRQILETSFLLVLARKTQGGSVPFKLDRVGSHIVSSLPALSYVTKH